MTKVKICGNGYMVANDNEAYYTEVFDVEGWLAQGNLIEPEFTEVQLVEQIEAHKHAKYNAIDLHFENLYTPTVVEGTEWHGTFTSILKLKGVIDMAQIARFTEVTFFDYHDQPHAYSLAEATGIVVALGVEYQTKFAQKKALQAQVMACTTQAELDAIQW